MPDDAKIFVEEAETIILKLRGEEKFDFIFVDVFDGLYPPDIFMQEQTIRAISECLNLDGGIVHEAPCAATHGIRANRELRSAFASTFKHTGRP